jgi:DHA1 family multidrug resistance protein-like MFS transporter
MVGAVMAPYWGRLADKVGKKRMVLRSGFSLAVVYFLGSLVHNPWELLGVRILQGIASGFVPASLAIVSSSVPQEKMGFSLGIMQTATLTGGILGPLFGGVLSHIFGMRMSFVVASAIIFCGTVGVSFLVTEPAGAKPPKAGSILDDFKVAMNNRTLILMLLLLLAIQMAVMLLQPVLTLYIAELQGQLEGAELTSGIVFSLAGIAGALAAPLWGRLGQTAGFVRILVIAFIGSGIFNFGQFFVANIWQFAVTQFLFGLFVAGTYPAINTMVVENTAASFRGRAFGLTTSANQVGSMIGPVIGGFVSSWIGIRYLFLGTGIFLVLTGLTVWWQVQRAPRSQS